MSPSASIALVGYAAVLTLGGALPGATAFGPRPSSNPPSNCTKNGCYFSYTNPAGVNQGRCGEVDASSRMPGDIWGYPAAVQRYVDATLKYYNISDNGGLEGGVLVQAPCNHTFYYQCARGGGAPGQQCSQTVSWADPELMQQTCSVLCHCNWPQCPDAPDDPGNQLDFCSLCGPKYNQPIEVVFWYRCPCNEPCNELI